MAPGFSKIIIVGAGPAGQILGLLLARQHIRVTIVEQASGLDDNPRATHYGGPAMKVLNKAGIGDDLRSRGFAPEKIVWRKLDGSYIAGIDNGSLAGDPSQMIALPLNQLGKLLYNHAKDLEEIEYIFHAKVTNIGQNDTIAWVDAVLANTGETARFEADYIIGCDGANSIVRRTLFGDMEFPGKTWDEQIVATNVYYDFKRFGYDDTNFIIDPEHWYMAARITTDGLWRVTYGEAAGLTNEEIAARQPAKFRTMLPGHPEPHQYRLVNMSPYKVHQRIAPKMRVGRFLLAADAAHLCNPFGGLGLTGGIVDVGGLYDCLLGIYLGKADDNILDLYDKIRREKYERVINPISSANLLRMFSVDPEKVLESDEFLKQCKQAESDIQLGKSMLQACGTS